MLSLSLSSSLPFQSFAFPILSLTHDLFLSLSHTRYIYLSLSRLLCQERFRGSTSARHHLYLQRQRRCRRRRRRHSLEAASE